MNEQVAITEITSDEKTMATLAHVLQLVGWWIAPLIIYLVKRDSKFVAFHAMQALLWQLILLVVWFSAMIVWFFTIFFVVFSHAGKAGSPQPPSPGFFLGFAILWLSVMGVMGINLVLAIFYGVKAGRGEWAAYPIIGRWARRIVNV
jgi:uncharacterized membrane protein